MQTTKEQLLRSERDEKSCSDTNRNLSQQLLLSENDAREAARREEEARRENAQLQRENKQLHSLITPKEEQTAAVQEQLSNLQQE